MRYLVLLSLLVVVGCEDAKKKTPPPVKKQKVEKVEAPVEEDLLDDAPDRIFGLPVPDRVTHHREFAGRVQVMTKHDLETVHQFFKDKLVDYEIVKVGKGYTAIGLHPYQSRVEFRRKGRLQYPVELVYRKGRKKKKAVAAVAKSSTPQKGSPVELRTKDGELLAPGARWGEPYTPPPNSPLAKKKFRSNFGKPFGTWVEQ